MFSVMGLVSNCFSLSIVPITSYFGFSRGSYAISQTLMFVCSAAFTLTSSRIYKKLDLVKAVRIAAVVVTVLTGAENLRRIDRLAQDALFQQPGVTSSDIVIIGIDEEALADLGPYQTWDRNVMASALEALAADPDKKPAVTAVDVLYAGETEENADRRLAEAARELGNVVTACVATFGERVTWENGSAILLR